MEEKVLLNEIAKGKNLEGSSSVNIFGKKRQNTKIAGFEIKESKELNNLVLLKENLKKQEKNGESKKEIQYEDLPPNITEPGKYVVIKINVNQELSDKFRIEYYESIRSTLNLIRGEDSLGYVLFLVLKNMEKHYTFKYGELYSPTSSDVALYSKCQVKGLDYPEDYYIDYSNPKALVFRIRKEDLELLHLLMHNFFLNNRAMFRGKRFTKAIFFVEILNFLKKKEKTLKKYRR